MSSTFFQIYIHAVFAVKGRQSLIQPTWEEQLFGYTTGIIQNKEQKMLAMNGVQDLIQITSIGRKVLYGKKINQQKKISLTLT